MNVRYIVQHHPSRASLLAVLSDRLGECTVISDPEPDGEPSPLRTYRSCLRSFTHAESEWTHGVIVQDDALPCERFRDLSEEAIAERPNSIISFFVSGARGGGERRVFAAHAKKERWAYIGGMRVVPLVATCWPRSLAEKFLEFSEQRYKNRRGDDAVAAYFVNANRLEVWATVPSLVEHPNVEVSLIGRSNKGSKDRSRVAALFVDTLA